MIFAATHAEREALKFLNALPEGLTEDFAEESREQNGKNTVTHGKKESLFKRICGAFINPFTAILFVLALVSVVTDIILAAPEDKNYVTVIIITTMVMISGLLRFIQETRSGNAAANLSKMICTTACVERAETGKKKSPLMTLL